MIKNDSVHLNLQQCFYNEYLINALKFIISNVCLTEQCRAKIIIQSHRRKLMIKFMQKQRPHQNDVADFLKALMSCHGPLSIE